MKLEEIYAQLLKQLKINGNSYETIYHPMFYTYPYALRFEIGLADLQDRTNWTPYVQSGIDRAKELYHSIFDAFDHVLVIFDVTPDREIKEAFSKCKMRRLRARVSSPFFGDEEESDERYFYRYLYYGVSEDIPDDLLLEKIVNAGIHADIHHFYPSNVYFYNVTKSLLFHLYDDRGADLIAFCAEDLLPFYHSKNHMLLDYDREEMARKLGIEL